MAQLGLGDPPFEKSLSGDNGEVLGVVALDQEVPSWFLPCTAPKMPSGSAAQGHLLFMSLKAENSGFKICTSPGYFVYSLTAPC